MKQKTQSKIKNQKKFISDTDAETNLFSTILVALLFIVISVTVSQYEAAIDSTYTGDFVIKYVFIITPTVLLLITLGLGPKSSNANLYKSKYLLNGLTKISAVLSAASFFPSVLTKISSSIRTNGDNIQIFFIISTCIFLAILEVINYLIDYREKII